MVELILGALTVLTVMLYLKGNTLSTKNAALNKKLNQQVEKILGTLSRTLDIIEIQSKRTTLLETKYRSLYEEVFGTYYVKNQDLEEQYKSIKFTDPTAQKLWDFLKDYISDDKIPVCRIEDALYMINADKIEYKSE